MVTQGPCLAHCYRCSPATAWAARAAVVYALACAIYILITNGYGTPLSDSFTPAQRDIRRVSAHKRAHAFWMAVVIASAVVAIWRPVSHASSTM